TRETRVLPGPHRADGRIRVRASSLFLGYWPEPARSVGGSFLTSDRGRLDASGRLVVLGRIDALINSGGEKIDPAVVEAAIRATGVVRDVAVCGVPDAEWGEAIVAFIAGARPEDESAMLAGLRARLSPPHAPKRFVHVREVPRTAVGKIDRRALTRLAAGEDCAQ
ncbi:MAG: AMP-binding enzyme, partial [Opitutaceae bacterium]